MANKLTNQVLIDSESLQSVITATKAYIDKGDTALQTNVDNKVDKKEGYTLSKNDFTDVLKAKLDGIEAGAKLITKVSQLENDSKYQTDTQVNAAIQAVVAAAPEALDTLKELADALNNDPDFAGNITKKLTDVNTAITTETDARTKADDAIKASVTALETKVNDSISKVDSIQVMTATEATALADGVYNPKTTGK